jgi:hypothetical protein
LLAENGISKVHNELLGEPLDFFFEWQKLEALFIVGDKL